ncbi:hypothetical protein H1R20_g7566, partial [Candolleomyces eurysporus]
MSRLETLNLSACLPLSDDVSHPESSSITLPSLRTLKLRDSSPEVLQFFAATQVPKEARINIELSDTDPKSESFGSLFSALRKGWILSKDMVLDAGVSLGQSEIVDLRIVEPASASHGFAMSNEDDELQLRCWFKNHDLPPKFDVDNPPASLALTLKGCNSVIGNSLLAALAERLDISSLRSLKIASHQFPTVETFELFKGLTKLDKLAIWYSHDALSNFLEVSKKTKDDDDPPFPALRSLQLHGVDFDEDLTGKVFKAVDALGTALDDRHEYHPSIERLIIERCTNFDEGHWEQLSCTLPEEVRLVWDEVEDIRRPPDDSYYGRYNRFEYDWAGRLY